MWRELAPEKDRKFGAGTSSDIDVLKNTFGQTVSTDDINTLQAMHRAVHQERSLWGEIAETLNRLQGDDPSRHVTLEIWTD